jgi:hypothetical protein
VTGPYEDEKVVPDVGMGMSVAQTFCQRHRDKVGPDEELTYYVREAAGDGVLALIVHKNGETLTYGHSLLAGRLAS